MSDFIAVIFLGSSAVMVGFVLVLGYLEYRDPSPPTAGPIGSRDVDKASQAPRVDTLAPAVTPVVAPVP